MSTPSTPSTDPNHVRWQAVYDIAPDFDPAYRVQLEAELLAIEHSPIGQAQLREFRRKHATIPDDFRWNVPQIERNPRGFYTLKTRAPRNGLPERDDQRKIVLSSLDAPIQVSTHLSGVPTTTSARYDEIAHTIHLVLPRALQDPYPAFDPKTNQPVKATFTLGTIVIHEARHGLQTLDTRFGNQPPISKACRETQAHRDEMRYVQETSPGQPYRTTYVDPDRGLAAIIETAGTKDEWLFKFRRWMGDKNIRLTPRTDLRTLVYSTADAIQHAAGCEPLTNEQIVAKTRAALEAHGIKTGDLHDIEIADWGNLQKEYRTGAPINLTVPRRK